LLTHTVRRNNIALFAIQGATVTMTQNTRASKTNSHYTVAKATNIT